MLATPEVASVKLPPIVTSPPTLAPAAGAVIEPVGGVLSTRIACGVVVVVWWPVTSVAIARRLYEPSGIVVVSSVVAKTGQVEVAIDVQTPPFERWNSTDAVFAETLAERFTTPTPVLGAVSEMVGGLLLTVTETVAEVVELPARSVATTLRVAVPSETVVVSQFTGPPAVEPICVPLT